MPGTRLLLLFPFVIGTACGGTIERPADHDGARDAAAVDAAATAADAGAGDDGAASGPEGGSPADASADAPQSDAAVVTYQTVVFAGDIVQAGRTASARATAALVHGHAPPVTAAMLAGDIARYGSATTISLLQYFDTYYKPASQGNWGQFDAIAFPNPGNHEYNETGAAGYFDYFAARLDAIKALPGYSGFADTVGKGYYSFDLGIWHVIAVNSNCASVGGCGSGSPQETWLAADLSAHAGVPTIAYWHHPRYACPGGGNDFMQAVWARLYDAGADLVFTGHNHYYQRWKRLDKSSPAVVDTTAGIRQFVVGDTGVSPNDPCTNTAGKPTDSRVAAQIGGEAGIGVLFLALGSDGTYEWRYQLASDGSVFDSGTGRSQHAP